MRKKINVLGLSLSHCATACLLQDGEIIGAVSEERFNRLKNSLGLPHLAINFLLKEAKITAKEVDLVVIHSRFPLVIQSAESYASEFDLYNKIARSLYRFPFLKFFYQPVYQFYRRLKEKKYQKENNLLLKKRFGFALEKILYVDHHQTHACAPLYGLLNSEQRKERYLVLTNDGMGDGFCTAVNIFENDKLSLVGEKTSNDSSLALVYTAVTKYLRMKPLEHEYKVMGLAPYADKFGQKKSYEKLKELVWLGKSLNFCSRINAPAYFFWMEDNLKGHRFDWIAGAMQQLTEELLVKWAGQAIKDTRLKKIVFGGGIFMNVKANMLITKIPEVAEAYFMPSATDESTAIGAAYFGYQKICWEQKIPFNPRPLLDLYLGPEYSESEVKEALKQSQCFKKYKVEKIPNIEIAIAQLLSKGKIVARFSGRMEWGARALGNRSILAHPSNPALIRVINEQIKGRDFWMPFAPTILYERQHDYIVNPKEIEAPFMILAFETTEKGRGQLKAAIHPYDFTCRPQIIKKEHNPPYYKIIKEFEKLTGIGAVLNTSFNLHGDPIVCSPDDALYTFENSGLEYLALENYLISKN